MNTRKVIKKYKELADEPLICGNIEGLGYVLTDAVTLLVLNEGVGNKRAYGLNEGRIRKVRELFNGLNDCKEVYISVDDLRGIITECTKVSHTRKIEKECKDCRGSGRVEWEYVGINEEYYSDEFSCPVCDGYGNVEEEIEDSDYTEETIDENSVIEIGGKLYGIVRMNTVCGIAEEIGCREICIDKQDDNVICVSFVLKGRSVAKMLVMRLSHLLEGQKIAKKY